MADDALGHEWAYQATMAALRPLLEDGTLGPEQYGAARARMLERYRPPLGALLAGDACIVRATER